MSYTVALHLEKIRRKYEGKNIKKVLKKKKIKKKIKTITNN